MCAEVRDKIVFKKNPGTPNLGAGYPPGLGALTKLFWVKAKKGCSFCQAERTLSIACTLGGQGTNRRLLDAGAIQLPHGTHLSRGRYQGDFDKASPKALPRCLSEHERS